MLAKLGDYAITCVTHNGLNNHGAIAYVVIHRIIASPESNRLALSLGASWSRQDVVGLYENGAEIFTAILKSGVWYQGDKVEVFTLGEKKYIRTDGNRTAEDNLGNLPEC